MARYLNLAVALESWGLTRNDLDAEEALVKLEIEKDFYSTEHYQAFKAVLERKRLGDVPMEENPVPYLDVFSDEYDWILAADMHR